MKHKWVERLKRGDEEVLKKIYESYRKPCRAFLIKTYGLSIDDASDVYQDAILVLFENVNNGKLTVLESSLKTYIFAIAKNLGLKRLSRSLKVQHLEHETAIEEAVDDFEADDSGEEQLDAMRTAFANLGEPCKTILSSYYYKGMSLKEIAKQLSYQSSDVAKTQKSRCMKQLRNALKS